MASNRICLSVCLFLFVVVFYLFMIYISTRYVCKQYAKKNFLAKMNT